MGRLRAGDAARTTGDAPAALTAHSDAELLLWERHDDLDAG